MHASQISGNWFCIWFNQANIKIRLHKHTLTESSVKITVQVLAYLSFLFFQKWLYLNQSFIKCSCVWNAWIWLVSVTEQWIEIKSHYIARGLSGHFDNSLILASSASLPNKIPISTYKLESLVTWNGKVAKIYSNLTLSNKQWTKMSFLI